MKTLLQTSFFMFTTLALATSAHATGGKPYIGAKVGQFTTDIDIDNTDADNATAFGVYGGFSINHHVGIEADFIKSSDADISRNDNKTAEYNTQNMGLYLALHQHLPNNTDFYVKGKLGVAKTTVESNDEKADKAGFAGGIGAGFKLSPLVTLEGEYTFLPTVENDAETEVDNGLWTVGLHYRF